MGWCAAKLDDAFFSASADLSEDLSPEDRVAASQAAVVEFDPEATRNVEPQTCTVCRVVQSHLGRIAQPTRLSLQRQGRLSFQRQGRFLY